MYIVCFHGKEIALFCLNFKYSLFAQINKNGIGTRLIYTQIFYTNSKYILAGETESVAYWHTDVTNCSIVARSSLFQ